MGVLFGAVILIGLLSWGVVKCDELSGLGRAAGSRSWRHPHGRLEAAYCEAMPKERPFSMRVRATFPAITASVMLLACAGALILEGSGRAAGVVAVDFLASGAPTLLIAGECLLKAPKSAQKFTTYILIAVSGLVAATVLGAPVLAFTGGQTSLAGAAAYLAASSIGIVVGCALAAAFVEEPVRIERRFEDGAESAVVVSPRSVAFKALRLSLVDEKAWNAGKRL